MYSKHFLSYFLCFISEWLLVSYLCWYKLLYLPVFHLYKKHLILRTSALYISTPSHTDLFLWLILHFSFLFCSCNPCPFLFICLLLFLVNVSSGIFLKIYESNKLRTRNERRIFWDIYEQKQFGSCRLSCHKKESRLWQHGFSNIALAASLKFPFGFSWHGRYFIRVLK